ncbi:MAG: FAD-dependent oxidoreductase [Balneolaceae bacterium]|nr:FAD-dependent oxidoreductase [Balneolaceae bacterium]
MSTKYDYDAVVIGGGAAGLTASGIAANFGAKTMMVEAERLGGDCTWTGCVPSKTLLKAGKVAQQMRSAGKYGLIDSEPEINFKKVIRHVHQVREDVYKDADKPEIFEELGVEVVKGKASFIDPHTIDIRSGNDSAGPTIVSSRYFFICAGASAFVPPIEGVEQVDYLTNDSLFEIDRLPEKLLIVGTGPIGSEMAQAMRRLGSEVTVLDMSGRIMTKDDPELAQMLHRVMEKEGIEYQLNADIKSVEQTQDNTVTVHYARFGEHTTVTGDALLMATGRKANVEGLALENADVEYTSRGIDVDDRCRTNQKHIYACGDITGRYQFTHMSEHMAKVATSNALLKIPMKMDTDHVPWVTYTDPELGHLGATGKELEEKGTTYETYRFPYTKVDRAVTESESEGLIKIYAKKWSGKILGVDILGVNAGELISEYAVAMRNGISLRDIADTIHPYPSYGLGARRAADQWYIKNQKEWIVKLIKFIFRYRGEVPDYSDPDRIV